MFRRNTQSVVASVTHCDFWVQVEISTLDHVLQPVDPNYFGHGGSVVVIPDVSVLAGGPARPFPTPQFTNIPRFLQNFLS